MGILSIFNILLLTSLLDPSQTLNCKEKKPIRQAAAFGIGCDSGTHSSASKRSRLDVASLRSARMNVHLLSSSCPPAIC